MVIVLAGGTIVLTAMGAMVVGCFTGTGTVTEGGLAAIGAMAVGCLVGTGAMLEGGLAAMGATVEGGGGAHPDFLGGSLKALITRVGST